MSAPQEHWGKNLRRIRRSRGLSLLELALRARTQPGHLSRVERGINGASDDLRIRLAAALGVRVEEIWSYPREVAS